MAYNIELLAGTSGTRVTPSNKLVDNADGKLYNAREPLAHAGTHASGGSDPVTPAAIGAATAAQGALADSAVQPTGTPVANQLAYWTTAQILAGANLVSCDATNSRIGIGTLAPLGALHVVGNGLTAHDFPGFVATDDSRSKTLGVQGDTFAYLVGYTPDKSFACGISTVGKAFAGSITAHDFELRRENVAKITLTADGATLPAETASRVVCLDANKTLKSSSVTTTELASLTGVNSNVQDQFDAEASARSSGDALALKIASNLSDLDSAATARDNLGLGDSATKDVGTTAGSVAAGDDARIVAGGTALQPTGDGSGLSGITAAQTGAASVDELLSVQLQLPSASSVPAPDGFRWTGFTDFATIFQCGHDFRVQWNTQSKRFDGLAAQAGGIVGDPAKKHYFVAPSGTSGGSGTVDDPLTFGAALAKSDVDVIVVLPGEYRRSNVLRSVGIARSISIFGIRDASGNRPVLDLSSDYDATSWTSEGSGTFSIAMDSASRIFDAAGTSDPSAWNELPKVADLSACQAAPGSWAQVSGTLYVHHIDGRDPTDDSDRTRIFLAEGSAVTGALLYWTGTAKNLYVSDLILLGGTVNVYAGGTTSAQGKTLLKNVTCAFSTLSNAVSVIAGLLLAEDCDAFKSAADGFNVHASGSNQSNWILHRCSGSNIGTFGGSTYNAITSHEACAGISVACRGSTSFGPVSAHINSAHAWELGCEFSDSIAAVTAQNVGTQVSAYSQVEGEGDATAWIHGGILTGSTYDLAAATGAIFTKNACFVTQTGNIVNY